MDPETYQLIFEAYKQNSIIRINNAYRGVPVMGNGNILELHGNEIKVQTNPLQIICARYQKFSFITFDNITLRARFNFAEIKAEVIYFKDIDVFRRYFSIRKYVRVEPPNQPGITAQVSSTRINSGEENKPIWLNSRLLDISIHGLAIQMNAIMYKLAPMLVYDPAVIKFNLPDPITNSSYNLSINGEIRDVSAPDEKVVRIGLEIKPDRITENIITHYVAQHQKLIIQELKDILEKELLTYESRE